MNIHSPYQRPNRVPNGTPLPDRRRPRYVVRADGDRWAVYFGTQSYRSFGSRFSAQIFADGCNEALHLSGDWADQGD